MVAEVVSTDLSGTKRERAIALYTFLKEFSQLRTKTIRQISSYERDGQVIWVSEIPREPGCDCIAWRRDAPDADGTDASDEVWLELRRPDLTPPPEPPESTSAWVRREQLEDSSLDLPELWPTLPGDSPEDSPARLDDYPEIQAAWDTYIEDHWWPWAEHDRREQAVQEVYTDLYSVYQRQQRLGERYEVIFGLGFLSWNAPAGYSVQRHLVAAHVSVDFDKESGTLSVTPAGEGARPSLEQDMLDPQHRPDPHELRSIEDSLEMVGGSLWAAGPLDGLLMSWVHSTSAEGKYGPSLDRPERSASAPVVHLAPALILRRRNERSFIRAFQEIVEQLKDGESVPEGVSRFIGVSEDGQYGDISSEMRTGSSVEETYFPLPANDAQKRIVQRLTANQGVLVQGPPGTGKSHTIVNLICHALACGQRVLVTSHAVRALKVLRRMIRDHSPDLLPLSVVLLGDDREALLALEDSVHGITTRQNTWTKAESQATIATLERGLDVERRRQANVLADLRAIRERETKHHIKFGYNGTLAQIAGALQSERESLSWIIDNIPNDNKPPLSADEFRELIALLRDERIRTWEAGGWVSLDIDGLPTIEAFEQTVRAELEARAAYEGSAPVRQKPGYTALEAMSELDSKQLADGVRALVRLIEQIENRPLSWTKTATQQILGNFERTWRQLREDTLEVAKSIAESARWLDTNPISPEPASDLPQLQADASDLLDHFKRGGGWGFGPFRAKVVKRALYIRQLRIGGRPCEAVTAVGDLLRRLDAELEIRRLSKRWLPHYDLSTTNFAALVTELEDICEPIEDALKALAMKGRLSEILHRTSGSPEPNWSDRASLHELRVTLEAVEVAQRYQAAREKIDRPLEALCSQQHNRCIDPAIDEVRVAIEERNAAAYAAASQRAAENARLAGRLKRKRELLGRVTARVPILAGEINETFSDAKWDERAQNFELAWNWSMARAWLTRLVEPGSEQQHQMELDQTERRIAQTLERIAAEKAWTHCFTRMTENERQHLVAWSKAVRSIGKGTGKYAPLHRRNAREHLNESRSAIPAWVMPLHRVAETIKPGHDLFDIAIIDEASQSGPEALLLAWLAKKLVVVGDDKQIHPTYAGVNFEDVNQLREQYIIELPHSDSFGVNHSFFDLAEIWFQDRIRLREHFRCMPEIIQFSNILSYGSEPLIPLRQYGTGRLEPTIATRHVPDGYQKGTASRSVNPPEADAVVQEIIRITEECRYAQKTIGVISLVGSAQAREIETRLIRKLGPEEMERRQIVCGDAYAFQGDERDVMFLSMVSAPRESRRIPAMTDAAAQRRFNVAASRAKDQLYLFHTATLSDLNPSCMRHQLLEYCLNPTVALSEVAGLDVSELERLALQADRQRVTSPAPFDSWFELDVFLRIARRGYRIVPQFKVGGYRIDLVVQGMDGSLAVECDGDAWHGADRYEADASRQRDLERCGWTFWRIRESAFRLDPEESLSDLWKTLDGLRIFPPTQGEVGLGATGQVVEPASAEENPNDLIATDGSRRSPKRREKDTCEFQHDPEEFSHKSSMKPHGIRSTDQTSGSEIISRSIGRQHASEQSPSQEGGVSHQPTLPLPPPDPVQALAGIADYVEWKPATQVPDPRTAKPFQLQTLLSEVVEHEGPVIAIRAYRLINRASGRQRLTRPAKSALNRACASAVRTGVVATTNPLKRAGQAQLVLRNPKSPKVILRRRGPRQLDELPPDEVATLLRSLSAATGPMDTNALKRRALEQLGLVRLTRNVSAFLDQCIELI